MLSREVQPEKAPLQIAITPSLIVIGFCLTSPLYLYNHLLMYIVPSGWFSNHFVLAKAYPPIFFTELGKSILSREVQPLKASQPISVTESGMTTFLREVQPEKAPPPIIVTEYGMSILSREVQPEKASLPIIVTEYGMSMLLSEVQPEYL